MFGSRYRTASGAAAVLSILCSVHAADAAEPARVDTRASTVAWQHGWDRFTPAEGAFTALANIGTLITDEKLPDYRSPHLDFEVPLLDPAGRALRARTPEHQHTWAQLSDIGFRSSVLIPYIVDAGVVALGIHHNVDVAAQLFLIDFEAFSFAGLAQHFISRVTSRPRPFVQDCKNDGKSTSYTCGIDTRDNRSLYGGHSSAAFTAAGLTCLHHQHLPLWGGGAADTWACVWAMSYASLVSMARVFADEHYMSDTIVGAGTGWFFGYLLPQWLHYGTASSKPKSLIGSLMLPGRTTSPDHPVLWIPTFTAMDDGGVASLRAVF